jgi:hypothetical protein
MGQRHQRQRENPHAPVTNIVTYVPKKGKEAELLALGRMDTPRTSRIKRPK